MRRIIHVPASMSFILAKLNQIRTFRKNCLVYVHFLSLYLLGKLILDPFWQRLPHPMWCPEFWKKNKNSYEDICLGGASKNMFFFSIKYGSRYSLTPPMYRINPDSNRVINIRSVNMLLHMWPKVDLEAAKS